jgi:hypothetical protein
MTKDFVIFPPVTSAVLPFHGTRAARPPKKRRDAPTTAAQLPTTNGAHA